MDVAQAVWPLIEGAKGRRPRSYYRPSPRIKRLAIKLINRLANVRPLTLTIPGVVVSDYEVGNDRLEVEGVKVYKAGDKARVSYVLSNTSNIPRRAFVRVSFAGRTFSHSMLLTPGEDKSLADSFAVDSEGYKPLSIKVYRGPYGFVEYDSVNESVPVGILDDSYKPVSEYPIDGAQNAEFDEEVDWEEKVYLFPSVSGYSFEFEPLEFGGFVSYEDRSYRRTDMQAYITADLKVTPPGSMPYRGQVWGIMVGVLYEDLRHFSLLDVTNDAEILSGGNMTGPVYRMRVRVPIPLDVYGHVVIIYGFNLWRGGLIRYAGGVVWQVDLFRLKMP